MQNITVIDRLRQAVLTARQLDSELGAGADADTEALALRQKIEVCENEVEALALLKKLQQLEQTSKIRAIRKNRLAGDSETAWQNASDLARAACNETSDLVGIAVGDAFENFGDLVLRALAPESIALAESSPGVAFQIHTTKGKLAACALAVGPANLCQNELSEARRRDYYQGTRGHAENALAVIDGVLSRLPGIEAQADLLRRAAAAFAAVLAADSRQVAA